MKKLVNRLGYGVSILLVVVSLIAIVSTGVLAKTVILDKVVEVNLIVRATGYVTPYMPGKLPEDEFISLYSDEACTQKVTALSFDGVLGSPFKQTIYAVADGLNREDLSVDPLDEIVDICGWSVGFGEVVNGALPFNIELMPKKVGNYRFNISFSNVR